jgi:hypothetical protein
VEERGLCVAVVPGRLAPEPVDRAVPGGRRDPRTGVRRDSAGEPSFGRDREGLLDRVLGDVDVAEDTNQRRNRSPRLVPEDLL